uniref:Uncharacterized protein n=1 Tax=Rhizophora mucronata TaxID=61149 RepID=A0A2P2J7V5_RHIMU
MFSNKYPWTLSKEHSCIQIQNRQKASQTLVQDISVQVNREFVVKLLIDMHFQTI